VSNVYHNHIVYRTVRGRRRGGRATLRALAAALGGTAHEYAATYTIVELPAMRATAGRLANASVSC